MKYKNLSGFSLKYREKETEEPNMKQIVTFA